VQAVVVSLCGVGGYSSVMRWMVVGVVRAGRDLRKRKDCNFCKKERMAINLLCMCRDNVWQITSRLLRHSAICCQLGGGVKHGTLSDEHGKYKALLWSSATLNYC